MEKKINQTRAKYDLRQKKKKKTSLLSYIYILFCFVNTLHMIMSWVTVLRKYKIKECVVRVYSVKKLLHVSSGNRKRKENEYAHNNNKEQYE